MVQFVCYIFYAHGKKKILLLGEVTVCREVKPPVWFLYVLCSLLFRIYCKLAAEGESGRIRQVCSQRQTRDTHFFGIEGEKMWRLTSADADHKRSVT